MYKGSTWRTFVTVVFKPHPTPLPVYGEGLEEGSKRARRLDFAPLDAGNDFVFFTCWGLHLLEIFYV